MSTAPKINSALIAALEHYAEGRYNPLDPSMFVHKDGKGRQHPWPLERACGVAAEVLADEELNLLKLIALQQGLKKYGMDDLYEIIMGEKLP